MWISKWWVYITKPHLMLRSLWRKRNLIDSYLQGSWKLQGINTKETLGLFTSRLYGFCSLSRAKFNFFRPLCIFSTSNKRTCLSVKSTLETLEKGVNMFTVNNKYTRATSITLNIFHPFSNVSIAYLAYIFLLNFQRCMHYFFRHCKVVWKKFECTFLYLTEPSDR